MNAHTIDYFFFSLARTTIYFLIPSFSKMLSLELVFYQLYKLYFFMLDVRSKSK